MNSLKESNGASDAPAAPKVQVSIIADVRTAVSKKNENLSLEVRISAELKAAFKAKAKRGGIDMSEVVIRAIEDYVGTAFGTRDRTPAGRHVRGLQVAEFRRRQAEVINLLVDIRTLLTASGESPMTTEASMKLLTETERSSRALFNLLARRVR